ncbi:carbonyl reductase [NADPH] 1 isoform X2 [Manis javanica]|uniref:carbonyl reductase [NADPH] 1 isoform X2 n=1 Tax=Manis javanica TaxID=9974 RepID=UPI003C6CEAE6
MSFCTRVALVTGANKGIGFAISRDLCRQFPGDVVLTSRDAARGQAAVQQLQAEGLSPRFHLLDIEDPQSIRALRDFLLKEYGGLDVLVNNAGIAFKTNDSTPFHIQAEVTMKTNFFGTRDVCTELLPLLFSQSLPPQALYLFSAPHTRGSLSMVQERPGMELPVVLSQWSPVDSMEFSQQPCVTVRMDPAKQEAHLSIDVQVFLLWVRHIDMTHLLLSPRPCPNHNVSIDYVA